MDLPTPQREAAPSSSLWVSAFSATRGSRAGPITGAYDFGLGTRRFLLLGSSLATRPYTTYRHNATWWNHITCCTRDLYPPPYCNTQHESQHQSVSCHGTDAGLSKFLISGSLFQLAPARFSSPDLYSLTIMDGFGCRPRAYSSLNWPFHPARAHSPRISFTRTYQLSSFGPKVLHFSTLLTHAKSQVLRTSTSTMKTRQPLKR
ncbi:hypothetical protein V8E36_008229 [Tilletia maclaganii]